MLPSLSQEQIKIQQLLYIVKQQNLEKYFDKDKDTEFVIKNQLMDLLTELKGLKFVTTVVLEIKKNNNKMMKKQNMATFLETQKQKQLSMKVILMIYLNQSIV